jgi:amino acid adenylation domain-containing protein
MIQTAYQRFLSAAAQNPDRTAFVFDNQAYTYFELAQTVTAIQKKLLHFGIPTHGRIAVVLHHDLITYAALIAGWGLGAGYIPISTAYPRSRIQEIIQQSQPDCVISSQFEPDMLTFCAHLSIPIPFLPLTDLQISDIQLLQPSDNPEALAYLLFTSGSTGKPKGVPIFQKQLSAFLSAILDNNNYLFSENDRFLQMFALTFDLSVFCYAVPLAVGAAVYPVNTHTGMTFFNAIDILEEQHITVALQAPSVLTYLQKYFDEIQLPDLRYSLFCGEALPASLVSEWQRCVPNAQIENVYGPTEATIFCTRYIIPKNEPIAAYNGIVSIGKPLSGTQLFIKKLTKKNNFESGELILTGAQVTSGYWYNPEKTAQVFEKTINDEIRYNTGDECFKDPVSENYFYIGRIDHQLKIDGYRVEPGEIEFHARSFYPRAAVSAVGLTQLNGNTEVHLFIANNNPVNNATDLLDYLRQQLPPYMIPRKVHYIDQMPLNANGKIDRQALINLICIN